MNDFGWALARMREGHQVRRDCTAWPANIFVGLAPAGGDITVPYVYIHDRRGETWPWTPGQWDLLAEDWTITERTAT